MNRRALMLCLALTASACKPDTPPAELPVAPERPPVPQDTAWVAAGAVVQFPPGQGADVYFAKLDIASCARRIDYVLGKAPDVRRRVGDFSMKQRECLVAALIRWCLEQHPKWFPSSQGTPENAYFQIALDSAAAQRGATCGKMAPDDAVTETAHTIAAEMPRIIPAN